MDGNQYDFIDSIIDSVIDSWSIFCVGKKVRLHSQNEVQ